MRPSTRLLLTRLLEDENRPKEDLQKWYHCELDELSANLRETFVQCHCDDASQKYLDSSEKKSNRFFLQFLYRILMLILGLFMSLPDMNGLLNRGKTFVLSADHLRKLLQRDDRYKNQRKKVLDIGAGDGNATKQLEQVFGPGIYATEASLLMQWRLKEQGFKLLGVLEWEKERPFDVISFLNVLDRCDKPLSLLQQMHAGLEKDDGILLMAVVLPFASFLMKGPRQVEPTEKIKINERKFEKSLQTLTDEILKPAGFDVIAWTRLPYFSEGDIFRPYYILSDALLLLRPI